MEKLNADQVLRERVLPKLEGIRKISGGYQALCPAHDDSTPSLSVSPGTTQPVVITCHAGCTADAVLAAIGLTYADLSTPRETPRDNGEWTPAGPASHVYDYSDENGTLLFQVLRIPQPGGKKTFRQRRPDVTAKSGFTWRLDGTRRVPYRLPEVLQAAYDGEVVYVVEGEKDADRLASMGLCATCNSGGAGNWTAEHSEHLAGATVVIVADHDKAGQEHARAVAASLHGVAAEVTMLEPPEAKDISDHLNAGGTMDTLMVTVAPQAPVVPVKEPDLRTFLSTVDPPRSWVIPGLLERGDRLIWTGFEGLGKSMAIRQIAVAAAAGVHPFSYEEDDFEPRKVLFIDCENSERQSRRHFRTLSDVARAKGHAVPKDMMFLIHRPAGIDLTKDGDAAWLMERVEAHRPELLVCGPWYRLHAADTEDERGARHVASMLDAARVAADCALVVEAHSPHGDDRNRSVRPIGSSLMRRWPELGMGIRPAGEEMTTVAIVPWRGARDERRWPKFLERGDTKLGQWPWIVPLQR